MRLLVKNPTDQAITVGAVTVGSGQEIPVVAKKSTAFKKAGLLVTVISDEKEAEAGDATPEELAAFHSPVGHHVTGVRAGGHDEHGELRRHQTALENNATVGAVSNPGGDPQAKTVINPSTGERGVRRENDPAAETASHHTGAQNESGASLPDMPVMEAGVKVNPEGTHKIHVDPSPVDSQTSHPVEGGEDSGEDKGILGGALDAAKNLFSSDKTEETTTSTRKRK